MRFHVRRRRHTPTIIIVALIDVLIVLLIFLMVTTTFKQQPSLKLVLPDSSQAAKEGASEHQPLLVSIDKDGGLRLGATDKLPVTIEQLKSQLIGQLAKDSELKVSVSADKAAPWGTIVKVMDVTKEVKVKSVTFAVSANKSAAK